MTLGRKLALLLVVVSALFLLNGCWVTFVYPIGDENKEAVIDSSIDGEWYQPDSNCSLKIDAPGVPGRHEPQGWTMYTMDYSAPKDNADGCLVKGGHHLKLAGHLIKIGNNRFFDMKPNPERVTTGPRPVVEDEDYEALYLELHSVLKLVKNDDGSILLMPIKFKWLDDQYKAKTLKLDTISDSGVVTSRPEKIRQFLMTYGDDPKVFSPSVEADGKPVWRFVRPKS